jgi:NAD(P)-dependent dehydrogenase (short-subunit alcohol dehydrogenase family)
MNCARPHVVVTGASSGIGRASAIRLADAGWHVYAAVRRPYDGESLRRVSAIVVVLEIIWCCTGFR